MKRSISIGFFLILSISITSVVSADRKKLITRIMEPKDYALKRFQEVLEENQSDDADINAQEKLISARARLALTEKKLEESKLASAGKKSAATTAAAGPDDASDMNPAVRRETLKALTARADFYRKRVQKLENQVLSQKTKEKEEAAAKAAPKKRGSKKPAVPARNP